MTLYADLADVATSMLAEFGQPVTLRRYSAGTYDPTTGAATTTSTDVTVNAAIFDYTASGQYLQKDSLIQEGDKQAFMDASVAVPDLKHHVIVGGVEYVIINVGEVNPAGTPVLYELHLRK